MSKRIRKLCCGVAIAIVFEALILIAPCAAQQLGNDRALPERERQRWNVSTRGAWRPAYLYQSCWPQKSITSGCVRPTIRVTRRPNPDSPMISARAGPSRSRIPDFKAKLTSFL